MIPPIGYNKIIGMKDNAKTVPNKAEDPVWLSK